MPSSKNNYGIFESVTFINEDGFLASLGLVTLVSIGLPVVMVTGCAIIDSIKKGINAGKIKAALRKATSKNEDIKEFRKRMKSVKYISINSLMNRIDITDNDKNNAKYGHVVCAVIEDSNGDIMAYAVMEKEYSNKYAFYITDKKAKRSKWLENFIKATFELHFGIVGPGVREFVNLKNNAELKGWSDRMKNSSEIKLSDNERKEALESARKLANSLFSKCKSSLGTSNYSMSITNKFEDDGNYLADININLRDYINNKIKDDEVDLANRDMIEDLISKMKPIFESYGFDVEIDTNIDSEKEYNYLVMKASKSDKYPYLALVLETNEDDYCCYTLSVLSRKKGLFKD